MLFPEDQSPISELLHRDHYTPDELARLLDISPEVVRHEVRVGRLKAFMIDHRVIDIRRPDVIDWLDHRHTELLELLQRGATQPATTQSSEE